MAARIKPMARVVPKSGSLKTNTAMMPATRAMGARVCFQSFTSPLRRSRKNARKRVRTILASSEG